MSARYVVGFLFDEQRKLVLLIRKQRPAWQKGHLNGVGGKVEPDETSLQAMDREFKEEAGLVGISWGLFCTIYVKNQDSEEAVVDFYRATGPVMAARTQTDEHLEIKLVPGLWHELVPNLRWLIPMAASQSMAEEIVIFEPDRRK